MSKKNKNKQKIGVDTMIDEVKLIKDLIKELEIGEGEVIDRNLFFKKLSEKCEYYKSMDDLKENESKELIEKYTEVVDEDEDKITSNESEIIEDEQKSVLSKDEIDELLDKVPPQLEKTEEEKQKEQEEINKKIEESLKNKEANNKPMNQKEIDEVLNTKTIKKLESIKKVLNFDDIDQYPEETIEDDEIYRILAKNFKCKFAFTQESRGTAYERDFTLYNIFDNFVQHREMFIGMMSVQDFYDLREIIVKYPFKYKKELVPIEAKKQFIERIYDATHYILYKE